MNSPRVGIYVRTSIVSKKYDSYEAELIDFCESEGWDNIEFYRDRVGGMIDEKRFDALEKSIQQGKLDTDILGSLFQQQNVDDEHNRDEFRRIMSDARNGRLDVVVVHDFGQVGGDRMEVFRAVSALLDSKARLVIPSVGEVNGKTTVPPASQLDFV